MMQAYLDGELTERERAAFEREVGAGRPSRLAEARERSLFVRQTLAAGSIPEVDTERALEQVTARLARHGDGGPRHETGHRSGRRQATRVRLAWAASITLFLSGAAAVAAIPGSPVRAWLERALAAPSVELEGGPAAESAPAPTAAARVVPSGERFVVVIRDLPRSGEIQVRVVADRRVSIDAPAGSRFTSGSDRIDVRPTSGVVRVSLPRDLPQAVLRLGDQVVLERVDGQVRTPGALAEAQEDGWVISQGGP